MKFWYICLKSNSPHGITEMRGSRREVGEISGTEISEKNRPAREGGKQVRPRVTAERETTVLSVPRGCGAPRPRRQACLWSLASALRASTLWPNKWLYYGSLVASGAHTRSQRAPARADHRPPCAPPSPSSSLRFPTTGGLVLPVFRPRTWESPLISSPVPPPLHQILLVLPQHCANSDHFSP